MIILAGGRGKKPSFLVLGRRKKLGFFSPSFFFSLYSGRKQSEVFILVEKHTHTHSTHSTRESFFYDLLFTLVASLPTKQTLFLVRSCDVEEEEGLGNKTSLFPRPLLLR